jgi:hypothetical protein
VQQGFGIHRISGFLEVGGDAPRQVSDGQAADVQSIEVIELGEVDGGRRRVEALQAELFDQVRQGEEFRAVVVRPAHQRHPVDHGLRQVTKLPEFCQVDREAILHQAGALALAHLPFAAGLEEQRQVHPNRLLPPESLVNVGVQRKGGQPFRAAQHVRDAHQVIVDHRCQVVERQPIGLDQDIVVQVAVLDGDLAPQQVNRRDRAFLWHPEADDVRFALRHAPSCLIEVDYGTQPVVACGLFGFFCCSLTFASLSVVQKQ